MIPRLLNSNIRLSVEKERKILILYGARQTGKTTLIQDIIRTCGFKTLYINADERKYHEAFSASDLALMEEVIDDNELLFIDEAQQIKEIGINLKILHDRMPDLRIIVTGSSSLDLANKAQEPLTGRTKTFTLLPVSIGELRKDHSVFDLKNNLPNYLLYGMYPEVLTIESTSRRKEHLLDLSRSYLYKDVLALSSIKNSDKLRKLLQLLALQIGSCVSINKLANALDLGHDTVNHYIDLLEKSFVIFRRSAFSRNLSKEISKMDKIYFYDIGIRNAVLENFTRLDLRNDKGAIWENFLVAERLKKNIYHNTFIRSYFWRVYSGAEIDVIEEHDGELQAYEIKANHKISKPSKTWAQTYPQTSYQTINLDNWVEWVT